MLTKIDFFFTSKKIALLRYLVIIFLFIIFGSFQHLVRYKIYYYYDYIDTYHISLIAD